MQAIFIFMAASPQARVNFDKTIVEGCELSGLRGFVDQHIEEGLRRANADGRCYLWGAQEKGGERNRATWQKMAEGDLVLGYRDSAIVSAAYVVAKLDNPNLAHHVWSEDEGEPFQLIYFLTKPLICHVPMAELGDYLGQKYQGFTSVDAAKVERIIREYGSLSAFVQEKLARRANPSQAQARPQAVATVKATLSEVHAQFSAALRNCHVHFGPKHDDLVRAFIAALATKRLVILTGVSGSGKTQIALRFGDWLGPGRSLVVPVRPDWTGAEALFGYEDALQQPSEDGRRVWHVPEALAFMLEAVAHRDDAYLLVLDEMNLAHVERYFADVLSGMESDRECLPNLRREKDGQWRLPSDGPARVLVPQNLFVVGTVNVDETTYLFSPKVLDRSNTFEFRVETSDLLTTARKPVACRPASPELTRGLLGIATDDQWHLNHPANGTDTFVGHLKILHSLVAEGGFEFGHRVFYEAVRFAAMLATAGDADPERALDRQIMQKVLPRLHGSRRRLEPTLCALGRFCFDLAFETGSIAKESGSRFDPLTPPSDSQRLPISFDKVQRMVRGLRAHGFTSFTEQ